MINQNNEDYWLEYNPNIPKKKGYNPNQMVTLA